MWTRKSATAITRCSTGHPVEHRIVAVADFLVHIRAQQKLGWVAQVQEALRDFHRLDTLVEQLHRLRPEVEAIKWHLAKLKQFAAPVNTLLDRAHVDSVPGGGLDETLPDPGRVRNATHPFELRHALLGHPEEGQQRPGFSSIKRREDEHHRREIRGP